MSAVDTAPAPAAEPATTVVPRLSWKPAVGLAVISVLMLLIPLRSDFGGDTSYRLRDGQIFDVPSVPGVWTAILLMVLICAVSVALTLGNRRTPVWLLALYAVIGVFGFTTWAGAGADTIGLIGLFSNALTLAVPLVFGALGGVIGERVGVVNIAIEAQFLLGAFFASLFATLAGSAWVGVGAAAVGGMLVALLLGLFAITYFVDQVIVGVVLNVLVTGLTTFLYSELLVPNADALNSPERLKPVKIPGLGDIPFIGDVFFNKSPLVYLLYVTVAAVTWALYRSKWGLRLRAVGEHPKAADTVGINVIKSRYLNLMLAGAIAGVGGAYFSLVSVAGFEKNMAGGFGYIALAAVIFGKWNPILATLAALLFGFTNSLQQTLATVAPGLLPSDLMTTLPYVVTILAVAGLVGRSRGPAAAGVPYRKG